MINIKKLTFYNILEFFFHLGFVGIIGDIFNIYFLKFFILLYLFGLIIFLKLIVIEGFKISYLRYLGNVGLVGAVFDIYILSFIAPLCFLWFFSKPSNWLYSKPDKK